MKKYLFLFLVIFVFVIGCENETTVSTSEISTSETLSFFPDEYIGTWVSKDNDVIIIDGSIKVAYNGKSYIAEKNSNGYYFNGIQLKHVQNTSGSVLFYGSSQFYRADASTTTTTVNGNSGSTTTTTTTTTTTVAPKANQYFWGTWVKMDNGEKYDIYEKCIYGRYSTDYILSSDEYTLRANKLGTFTRQSANVMMQGDIPYYRLGGTNIPYTVKVVGYTGSRAGKSLTGQHNKSVSAQSQTYTSHTQQTTTDGDGVAHFTAPTVNDVEKVTVETDTGDISMNITIGNNGSNMGTIAIVQDGQVSLKTTGSIAESDKTNGYLYNNITYPMTLTITNVSNVLCDLARCTVESADGNLTLTCTDYNLSNITISNLGAGYTKTLSLKVTCDSLSEAYIDTSIRVTVKNENGDIWEDFVPLKFFRQTTNFAIATASPENNKSSSLNGYVIYPDGNGQHFSVSGYKLITVPQFNDDQRYIFVFCGATVGSTMSSSTEMFYSFAKGSAAWLVTNNEDQFELKKFAEPNDTEDGAYRIDTGFKAMLRSGDIDYYSVGCNPEYRYTVRFDANGGDGDMTDIICDYDKSRTLPVNTFTKTGYKFEKWNSQPDGSGTNYTDGASVKNLGLSDGEVVTLYVQWTPITYTVRYYQNYGNNYSDPVSRTYDVEYTLWTGFTRSGYAFIGWNTASDGSGTEYAAGEVVKNLASTDGATVSLYSQWKETYTIRLDGNGGKFSYSNGGTSSTYDLSMVCDQERTLMSNQFTRTGYTLKCWNTASDGSGTDYAAGATVKNLSTTAGAIVTLYAQWKTYTYTVAFDANGGEGDMTDRSFESNKSQTLSTNTFTKTGYKFTKWNTKSDGLGTNYTDGASVKNLGLSDGEVVTLYAQWLPITYTVRYYSNYSNSYSNPESMTYDAEKALRDGYTRTGYAFTGWNTASDGSGTNYAAGEVVKNLTSTDGATVSLYAQWKEIYTIKFNSNGGSGSMSSLEMTFYEERTLTANQFTKTGCTFRCWNTASNGSGTDYAEGAVVKNMSSTAGATVTLYAQWTPITYTITYHISYKGSLPYNATTSYTVESETIMLPVPTSDTYTFAGWYTSDELTTSIAAIETGSSGNVEVWAGWVEDSSDNIINWSISSSGTYNFYNSSGNLWQSSNYNINSTTAESTWQITLLAEADVSIPYSVSSESNYDKLTITLDGAVIANGISGTQSGTYSASLTAGTHTLSASYSKDGSTNTGDDRGYVTLNPVYNPNKVYY